MPSWRCADDDDPRQHRQPDRRLRLGADPGLHDPDHRLHLHVDVLQRRRADPVLGVVAVDPRLPARRLRAVPGDLPAVHPAVRPAGPQPDGGDHRARRHRPRHRQPHPAVTRAHGRTLALAALVLVGVVALDQLTKALVRNGIEVGEEDSVLPAISLVHVRNSGVAFGAFSGGGLIVVALVAAALSALLYYFATHLDKRLVWLPTGMLLGGSIGNIIDRVRDGAVTDFVKLPAWPAFNVADVSITFGVLVLLWVIEQQDEGRGEADGHTG